MYIYMLKLHSSIAISCWLPRLRPNSWIGVVFWFNRILGRSPTLCTENQQYHMRM